jgi:AraC-like DNA-binding protein
MLSQSYLSLRTGRLKPSEKWMCEGDELLLVFPKAGVGQFTAHTGNFRVTAGDAVILNGRVGSKLSALADGELIYSWFYIALENLFPLFTAREIPLLQNIPHEFRSPRVYQSVHPLTTQCHQLLADIAPQCDLDHRSQLLRVVALLLSGEFKSSQQRPPNSSASAENHLVQVFERLSSHELLNLSIDELAQKFSCSRRHLSRLFHQHFGLSVASLRMEMRLLKASSMLRDPSVKVINVAEQCGFNHLGLFNTCFKRRFNMTPGQWRNAQSEKNQTGKSAKMEDTCPLRLTGLCPWHGNTADGGSSADSAATGKTKPGNLSHKAWQLLA